eukprot:1053363-Prymnesium_polylepis.1
MALLCPAALDRFVNTTSYVPGLEADIRRIDRAAVAERAGHATLREPDGAWDNGREHVDSVNDLYKLARFPRATQSDRPQTQITIIAMVLPLLFATTAATDIRLGLEWFLNPDHLPLVVALSEGLFADAGLNVTLVEPADHWYACSMHAEPSQWSADLPGVPGGGAGDHRRPAGRGRDGDTPPRAGLRCRKACPRLLALPAHGRRRTRQQGSNQRPPCRCRRRNRSVSGSIANDRSCTCAARTSAGRPT